MSNYRGSIGTVLWLCASVASATPERSAESVHARGVEESVQRYLARTDLSAVQRLAIEDGLRSFLSDQATNKSSGILQEPKVTFPEFRVTPEEIRLFRAQFDEEPELPPPGSEPGDGPGDDVDPPTAYVPPGTVPQPEEIQAIPQPVFPIGGITCIPGNELLLGGRFIVRATVTNLVGQTFTAGACRMTNAAGYFFFFDATNVEVPVKMLNACFGGSPATHWIFITGLTNFGVQTTFFDVASGITLTHTNNVGNTFPSSINQQTPFPCP